MSFHVAQMSMTQSPLAE